MEIIKFNKQPELEQIFKSALSRKTLIPILGAGFTNGEDAHGRKVPGGKEFKQIMIENICKHSDELTEDDFEQEGYKFSEIANEFFKRIPKDKYKKILQNCFTKVRLSQEKRNLLNIGWPYIYTLNIDDAIERNSAYNPVLPYRRLAPFVNELQCVFKMHGDVLEELKYDEMPNIIFSQEQYIKSLESNTHILKFFQSDYSSNNTIFIGCSLDDELDLKYAISTSSIEENSNLVRIFVTREEPKGLRKSRLEDFKISAVLLVEDYADFYNYLYGLYDDIRYTTEQPFDEFKNPDIQELGVDVDINKEYLLDLLGVKSSSKSTPYFTGRRDLESTIIKKVEDETVTVISGPRYSGKTILAKTLVKDLKNKNVYLFPTHVSFSQSEIKDLLKIENSYLIFDTNSIDVTNLTQIKANLQKFFDNKTNLIILSNKSDSLVNNISSSLTNNNFYSLPNRYSENELDIINDKLSRIGLIEIEKNLSLLDNCYRMFKTYGSKLPIDAAKMTINDFKMTLILVSDGKIYSVIFRLFDITIPEVDNYLKKMSPIVESQDISNIERHQHSGYKITSNSTSWIFRLLSEYKEKHGHNRVRDNVYEIIKTLKESGMYESIYKKIITFDNLNQVFSGKSKGEAGLILNIYEKLESLLYSDSHFWLQRAKSIKNLKRNSIKDIRLAIDYAKKAYHDASRDTIETMATTTLALLYCRLVVLTKHKDSEDVKDAISWLHSAIQVTSYNKRHVKTILEGAKDPRSDIYKLCHFLLKNVLELETMERKMAEEIINMVLTAKN
ncbi:MAG: hypothetical protein COA36_00280 [Desulfotalea sp.]|nr:MAG: hypothetical protein COA36_00280 [Desulfotalea sp.]